MRRWKIDASQGALFRRLDRWSNVWEDSVSGSVLNTVIKQRLKLAGLKPKEYSAHGIRSGFMTEARNQGSVRKIVLMTRQQQSQTALKIENECGAP